MKIEELNEEILKNYSVEYDLYKSGMLSEEKFIKLVENDLQKQEKRQEAIKEERIKRKMTDLVKVLNKSPDMLSNIKTLMDYRELRVLQVHYAAWISELRENSDTDFSYFNLSKMEESAKDLDYRRRNVHNRALGNFVGIIREYRRNQVEQFYKGQYMDPSKQSDEYGDPNIRKEMTDAILEMLHNIEDVNINELSIATKDYKEGLGTFKIIRKELEKQTRDYGVKSTLKEDDGTIELY